MPKLIDLAGQRFGRLTITQHVYGARWRAECDCGTTLDVLSNNVRSGRSTSCGCLKREMLAETKRGNRYGYKHGHAPVSGVSPEYTCWAKMRDRCFNERSAEYFRYGGRGITVCDRWRHDFSAFFSDMGARPSPQHSIDRIDNDGDYEPSNCRWATKSEQNANRRPYTRRK